MDRYQFPADAMPLILVTCAPFAHDTYVSFYEFFSHGLSLCPTCGVEIRHDVQANQLELGDDEYWHLGKAGFHIPTYEAFTWGEITQAHRDALRDWYVARASI